MVRINESILIIAHLKNEIQNSKRTGLGRPSKNWHHSDRMIQ